MWGRNGLIGRRMLNDRRKQPTPALSRFIFWGRRTTLRRKKDQGRGGYVDRYHSGLLSILTMVVGLNILDAVVYYDDTGKWRMGN